LSCLRAKDAKPSARQRWTLEASCLLTALVCALILSGPQTVGAEPNLRTAIVALAPLGGTAKIELVAQTVDLDVVESGDRTILNGQLAFKVHNTDRLTRTEQLVGFPTWGGGATELNEKSFTQFVISQNGETIQPQWQTSPLKLGSETRSVRWLTFPLKLAEDERATIQVTLRQDLGDATLPTITFAQAPAILWKGYVGSARYAIHVPVLTTPEQFRVISPAGSTFDGKSISWLFSEFNPEVPTIVQLVKPRLWREILQARSDLTQGDSKAGFTLGVLYAQLARTTQSLSDFSLAVAAYQRGGELDPSSPAAALELARLYEARLRGEFGKVDDENAIRAAALEQWQRALKLNAPGTEARDAVAQHALTLAQLARRTGRFDAALALLDSARGAGSAIVTATLLDNEMRADQAGLALEQMDEGRWAEVLQQIQGERFGSEAKNDLSAFQPRFTDIQIYVGIDGNQQALGARLTPFPAAAPALEKSLNEWIAGVRRVPGAEGTLTVDGGVYNLTLRLTTQTVRAGDLPTASETVMLKEVLIPMDLKVTHTESLFTTDDAFSARYALTDSQRSAQGKVDEIDRALKALNAPAADESQEMVRRLRVRALEQYRTGWQELLNGSSARVTWHSPAPGLGTDEQWDLRPGDAQTLDAHRMSYQWWTIVGACLAIVLGAAGGTWLVVMLLRRKAVSA
jgi:tetratricopeptide (TPR) repeat protein